MCIRDRKWIAEGGAAADVQTASRDDARKSLFLAWAVAGVALVAAIGLAFFHFGGREARPVVRTQIASSDKWDFNFVGDNACLLYTSLAH